MTKKPIDYSQSKIYRLVCNVTNKVYIGSTTKKYLSQRLTAHISDYKQYLKGNQYFISSFEILQNDNYSIELIELFSCSCKDELRAREGYHIRNNVCINKRIEGRSRKEHYEANKEQIAKYKKEHYEANKEQILEKQKKPFNCECGSIVQHCQKARHNRSKIHQSYLSQLEPTTEPINNI